MRTLNEVLLRATSAIVGPEDAGFPPVDATEVGARLDQLVSELPRDQRRLLSLGAHALQWLAVVRFARRFHRLDDARAQRLLEFLADGPVKPLRRLVHVLKMLTQFAYFVGPEAWGGVGYDGPWLGRREVRVDPAPRLDGETVP